MIRIGRIPGKIFSVEYTEDMIVKDAILGAKRQASSEGLSFDVSNCQIRVGGVNVDEFDKLEDGALVVITTKVKGNGYLDDEITFVYVDGEEYALSDADITVDDLIESVLGVKNESAYLVYEKTGEEVDRYDHVDELNSFKLLLKYKNEAMKRTELEDLLALNDDSKEEKCHCNYVTAESPSKGYFSFNFEFENGDDAHLSFSIAEKNWGNFKGEKLKDIVDSIEALLKDLVE